MNLQELKKRVAGGENLHTEFKHKIHFPEKIAREIVAFTNTEGGLLLIGVDDDKSIFGLKNADEEIYALRELIKKYIRYHVNYDIQKVNVHPKKDVLAVEIFETHQKPNYALGSLTDRLGIAYVRVADKSVQASREMIKILAHASDTTALGITYGEMERKVLKMIDQQGYTTLQVLVNNELISQDTASETLVRLTLAGILYIVPEEGKEDKYYLKA